MSRALPPMLVLAMVAACGSDKGKRCRRCDTGTVDPGVPVVLETAGLQQCAAPELRDQAYFDVQLTSSDPPAKAWFQGSGVVVADLDGDGLDDIVVPGAGAARIYWATGTGTYRVDPEGFAGIALWFGSGGSAADYDGDGDLDLLITRFLVPDRLLRNDGGVFVDVSESAGIAARYERSMASSWADYDRDGDLDLFIGGYGHIDQSLGDHTNFAPADPSLLYVNNGDGTFTDRSDLLPRQVHDGYTLAGGFHDLNGDMWPELYVVNDFGQSYPNVILWNREGQLELDTGNTVGLAVETTAMSLAIGDLNGDELPDMLMPAFNEILLMVSNAETGLWYESSAVSGIHYEPAVGQKIGWGSDMVDLDNDGDLDLPIAFGWLDSVYRAPVKQTDAVFVQLEDGTFEDRGMAFGLADQGIGRGFVATDLNRDGWLDMVQARLDGPARISLSRCGTSSWLEVALRQPDTANVFAIGAQVRAFTDDGPLSTRVVMAGGHNLASGGPPRVHFGLGDHEVVRRLQVTWPDGTVSNVVDVDARQHLTVVRGP